MRDWKKEGGKGRMLYAIPAGAEITVAQWGVIGGIVGFAIILFSVRELIRTFRTIKEGGGVKE